MAARLLGTSLESPVFRGILVAGASLMRLFYLKSSELIHKLEVLLNSRPSSLRFADVAGTVVAQRRRRIKDEVLVLVVTISCTPFLFFLTSCVVF